MDLVWKNLLTCDYERTRPAAPGLELGSAGGVDLELAAPACCSATPYRTGTCAGPASSTSPGQTTTP